MTQTQTQTATQTATRSVSAVRHIAAKIASDLLYLHKRFPSVFRQELVEMWQHDIFQWIKEGYSSEACVYFEKNGEVICRVDWSIHDDSSISNDDTPGRIKVPDLSDAKGNVRVQTTDSWTNLTDAKKQEFYDTLKDNWGTGKALKYADGLTRTSDREYSSQNVGVARSVLK